MKRLMALTGVVLLVAVTASADIYTVRADGTGDFPTIQAAIDACVDADIIELSNGTYIGDGNRDINYQGKAITVRSQSGEPDSCIIDCEGSEAEAHRGFIFESGEGPASVLQGIKIINGYADETNGSLGGAIRCFTSAPTITGCVFYNNTAATQGGAISILVQSDPTLSNCVFLENEAATNGGAIYMASLSSGSMLGCHFTANISHNESVGGGGLYAYLANTLTIDDCEFIGNEAAYGAGVLFDHGSILNVSDSIFKDNTATFGGTLSIVALPEDETAIVEGCTFAGNHGINWSGIRLNNCRGRISSCTFYGNNSLVWTGGTALCLYNGEAIVENSILSYGEGIPIGLFQASSVTLTCCDLYGHTHGDWLEPYADQLASGNNLCCIPVFCDVSEGDFTLAANSPCAPFTPPNEGCDLIGAWPVDQDCIVTTAPDHGAPAEMAVLQIAPNPFNPRTEIHFELPESGSVSVEIFDLSGRRVRVLAAGTHYEAGAHSLYWNGSSDDGELLPSGVYFCRLQVNEFVETRKMTMLK